MAQRNTVQIIINAKDDASSILAGVGGALEGVGKFALGAVTAVGAAAVGIGAAIGKLAIDAAPLQGVQAAFRGLAESADIGADDMLAALERGSAGMISQRELMTSFNKAAQLVSVDFASVLPDAMGALGKVAAATGEDMGYLLDSLVVGVGRLSPMILDNLGIQVSLTEANQAYADSIGATVEDLTKEQQQIALTNQVMEKLAANTEAMPDVVGSATAGLAQMGATLQNIKDQAGLAFGPALQSGIEIISKLADKAIPILIKSLDKIAPSVDLVVKAFGFLIEGDVAGALEAVWFAISNLFGEDVANQIFDVIEVVQESARELADFFNNEALPIFESVKEWFLENWPIIQAIVADAVTAIKMTFDENWPIVLNWLQELWAFVQDNIIPILAGIGAAILAVVVPAFVTWATTAGTAAIATITALAPVIAPIAAIGAAVALLVAAWENDWGGIRTFLTAVWEGKLKPIFEELKLWLDENIPIAIEILRAVWEEVLLPALNLVWEFIQDSIIPILEAVAGVADAVLGLALTVLAGIWQNVLQPALETVWGFLRDNILPIFESVSDFVDDTLGPILSTFGSTILTPLVTAFEFLASAAEAFELWLGKVKDALESIEIPWWARPGSPPPLADAFTDMGNAVKRLAIDELPRLAMEFNAMASPLGDGAEGGDIINNVTNNFNQEINVASDQAGAEALGGFQDMRAMVRG